MLDGRKLLVLSFKKMSEMSFVHVTQFRENVSTRPIRLFSVISATMQYSAISVTVLSLAISATTLIFGYLRLDGVSSAIFALMQSSAISATMLSLAISASIQPTI